MTVAGLLEELRQRNVEVRAEGDRLRCAAPTGVLTPQLRDELQKRKAEILEFLRTASAIARQPRSVVPLQPAGSGTPVFGIAGHNGDVFCYRAMAQHLGGDQPLFGLQPPGVDGRAEPLTSVQHLAAYFTSQIREFRDSGPYIIAGYCAGGAIAFELARQLQQAGERVSFVALFASPHPTWYRFLPQLRYRIQQQVERVTTHLLAMSHRGRAAYVAEKLQARRARRAAPSDASPDPLLTLRRRIEVATIAAVRDYTPEYFDGRLALFLPTTQWLRAGNALMRWSREARETAVYCGPDGCPVDQMLREPYAVASTDLFRRCVDEMSAKDLA